MICKCFYAKPNVGYWYIVIQVAMCVSSLQLTVKCWHTRCSSTRPSPESPYCRFPLQRAVLQELYQRRGNTPTLRPPQPISHEPTVNLAMGEEKGEFKMQGYLPVTCFMESSLHNMKYIIRKSMTMLTQSTVQLLEVPCTVVCFLQYTMLQTIVQSLGYVNFKVRCSYLSGVCKLQWHLQESPEFRTLVLVYLRCFQNGFLIKYDLNV